jgi:hypothetical protein
MFSGTVSSFWTALEPMVARLTKRRNVKKTDPNILKASAVVTITLSIELGEE